MTDTAERPRDHVHVWMPPADGGELCGYDECELDADATVHLAKPGCKDCSFADNGCSLCHPQPVQARIDADNAAEDDLEARARAAVDALGAVMRERGGPELLEQMMSYEDAMLSLAALVPPRLQIWAGGEVARRAQAFQEAGMPEGTARVAAVRSLQRDFSAGVPA